MKFLLLSFVFLYPLGAMTKEVNVQLLNRKFNVSIQQKKIHINAHDIDLSLEKTTCNSRIFEQTIAYHDEIYELVKNHKVSTVNVESFIIIDGRKIYIDPFSRVADYVRNLPNHLIESKLKEKIVCDQK